MSVQEDIAEMTKDPVCGKSVRRNLARRLMYGGATHVFCSRECLSRFCEDPDRYVRRHSRDTPEKSEEPVSRFEGADE